MDRQTQNWLKDRQRQKEEARLAREVIKAKLEQDKLERQAQQRNAVTGRQHRVQDSILPTSTSGSASSVCRIQLKLPAGNSKVVEMKGTDTLGRLRECVAEQVNRSVDGVLLCSSYPRKELSHDMDSHTMLQLQLVPSGVIIVREKKGMYTSSSSSTGGGIVGVLMSLIHFLVYCLNLIKNTVSGLFSRERPPVKYSESGQRHPPSPQVLSTDDRTSMDGGTGSLRVRKFRQEDYRDDSDEDGTYNGNSTQQK